jgi:hypothetical protein
MREAHVCGTHFHFLVVTAFVMGGSFGNMFQASLGQFTTGYRLAKNAKIQIGEKGILSFNRFQILGYRPLSDRLPQGPESLNMISKPSGGVERGVRPCQHEGPVAALC